MVALLEAGPRARPRRRRPQHRDAEGATSAPPRCSPPRCCAAASRCGRRPRARSATSTRCARTPSRSASVPPVPARATSRSRSRCRRCRRRRSTASSSPGPRSRRASGSGSCPATSSPRSTRTCARSTTRSTTCSSPRSSRRLMERGTIEVAPLAFMRGRTLNDSFIILDEAQNTTPEQMKMFLTRLGFGSKIVVTGDVTQIDLPEGRGRSRPPRGARHPRRHRRPRVRRARRARRRAPQIVQDIVNAYERANDRDASEWPSFALRRAVDGARSTCRAGCASRELRAGRGARARPTPRCR